jgi:hypothetical protein
MSLLASHDRKAFDHAMNDAILWGQFKEHAAQNLCVENCLFHDEVFSIRWLIKKVVELLEEKRNTGDVESPGHEVSRMVANIYKKFIKEGAPYELNIPSSIRSKCKKEVLAGNYSSTCFQCYSQDSGYFVACFR